MSTLIIAEVGVNHDGNLRKALKLVEVAADVGADVCKFQAFSAENVVSSWAPKAPYQMLNTSPKESHIEMLRRLSMPDEHYTILADRCKMLGIEFLCTAFDIESLHMLQRVGLQRLKIPSGEVTNLPLLREFASVGLPIILSTGMSDLQEVVSAVNALVSSGADRGNLTLLHCTSQYPAPPESVNLRAMVAMQDALGLPVGYSDHTRGWEVSVAAVALGAVVIEKHLTLDSTAFGPDHSSSLEPHQFADLVKAVRVTETALGHEAKTPHSVEIPVRDVARRSIVARRAIAEGEVLKAEDLATKRPAGGLSPMVWDSVVGSIARRNFEPDEFIEL